MTRSIEVKGVKDLIKALG